MSTLLAKMGRSTAKDTRTATQEAIHSARKGLGGKKPVVAFVTATVEHKADEVHEALKAELPDVMIHGITTSLGLLGNEGVIVGPNGSIGVMLIAGDAGLFFGVGSAEIAKDGREAGKKAAEELIRSVGNKEEPRVILFNASPGKEEDLLAGVADIFPSVPIYGGSAADHAIAGQWMVFKDDGASSNAVSLLGVYGDVKVGGAFKAPYRPSGETADVTESNDRRIFKLNGRPAADLLREWVGASISEQAAKGGNILAQSSLSPLGIRHATLSGDQYITMHPASIDRETRAVDVFARAEKGRVVCRMNGTEADLVKAIENVFDAALKNGGMRKDEIKAAFLIYCAGCAGTIGPKLDDGLRSCFGEELKNVPLMGLCTFGEQGYVPEVGNQHSNLSVGMVLLADG